jgi:hypothetical protein
LLTLVLNVWSVVLVFSVTEIFIRLFTVSRTAGPMFANTILLSRRWESVAARSRAILAKASAHGSYLIYDKELGFFAKKSITELPFVEYDGSFQRTEWESRFYHYSYSAASYFRNIRVGHSHNQL